MTTTDDPYAALKERAWREVADIDERLVRGEIDEQEWFDAMSELVTEPYLRADTPWAGSGKSGTAADWDYSRSHIAHAIDKPGRVPAALDGATTRALRTGYLARAHRSRAAAIAGPRGPLGCW